MHEIEPEFELPVSCPCCGKRSLSDFRLTVIAEGLQTNHLRLYANCHVSGWDASDSELAEIRDHLDGLLHIGWQGLCNQMQFC